MDCRSSFPKIIAHQGICVNGHTNTIPAFKAAVAAGAEMIEMNVHETGDGHFIVFHDDAFTPETPAHKTMIRALQRKNKTTFVWTVDNPEKMRKYILMHVDGIITNCPQRLKTLRPLD